MKRWTPIALLSFWLGACAHAPIVAAPTGAAPASGAALPPSRPGRVSLPYRYQRHGVVIKIYSVEFSGDRMLVTAALQETRGEPVSLSIAKLMNPETAGGQALPCERLVRGGQAETTDTLALAPKEQSTLTLAYRLPPAFDAGTSVTLRFPTGKWWSSSATMKAP